VYQVELSEGCVDEMKDGSQLGTSGIYRKCFSVGLEASCMFTGIVKEQCSRISFFLSSFLPFFDLSILCVGSRGERKDKLSWRSSHIYDVLFCA